jgi:choline-sulfatase
MTMKKYATSILTLGASIGFLIGLVVAGFNGAFKEISTNRYLHYKMYRLAVEALELSLLKMAISIATATLLMFILIRGLGVLFSKLGDKSRSRVKKLLFFIAWCVLFIPTGWVVNHYLISFTKFHPVSLLVDLGIAVLSVLFILAVVMLLGNGRGEALLRIIDGKRYLKVSAAVLPITSLVLSAAAFIYINSGVRGRPNIIYTVVDTLRYDRLGYSGYQRDTTPTIDGLAQEGIIFKNAYGSAPWTKPSVASIFSSLYPNHHGAINRRRALPEEVPTMAEILKNAGYKTFFFSGKNNYIGKKFNFQQGFDHYFNKSRNCRKLIGEAIGKIKSAGSRPFFAYIHLMDVHLPYNRNEYNYQFTARRKDSPFGPGKISHITIKKKMLAGELTEDDKEFLTGLYDGQVRFVDKSIQLLVSWLKEKGIFDNTLLVITADHGEELWDHKNFEHGHSLYEELVHVPLLLVGNKLNPSVEENPVRSIDLLPTVLTIAGIDASNYNLEGTDILSNPTEDRRNKETPIFFMNTLYGPEKYGLRYGDYKFIFNTKERTEEKNKFLGFPSEEEYELYDITDDHLETENLANFPGEQETMSRMKEILAVFIDEKSAIKGKRVKLDKKTKDELKSLGYL